eukprot:COSAG02_NODE_1480_length_12399_cov_250.195935_10_plen_141_part_00
MSARNRGGGGIAALEESLIGWATPAATRLRFKTESRGGTSLYVRVVYSNGRQTQACCCKSMAVQLRASAGLAWLRTISSKDYGAFVQHFGQGEVSTSHVHSIAPQLASFIGTPDVPLLPIVTLTKRTLVIGKLPLSPERS